jgi:tRNA(Leu) C34 or U34 (ribose-2'-O)-methylase TrmL
MRQSITIETDICVNEMLFARLCSLCVTYIRLWGYILQVKEQELSSYLVRMRAAGYLVVALEQTAGSVKLQDAKFPRDGKVVVLLGREKLGVPVELLQLVDVCIEIPQLGIVRSLNVHVSGAILIWEYTKQQLAARAAVAAIAGGGTATGLAGSAPMAIQE